MPVDCHCGVIAAGRCLRCDSALCQTHLALCELCENEVAKQHDVLQSAVRYWHGLVERTPGGDLVDFARRMRAPVGCDPDVGAEAGSRWARRNWKRTPETPGRVWIAGVVENSSGDLKSKTVWGMDQVGMLYEGVYLRRRVRMPLEPTDPTPWVPDERKLVCTVDPEKRHPMQAVQLRRLLNSFFTPLPRYMYNNDELLRSASVLLAQQ